jgi:hypothetical protein
LGNGTLGQARIDFRAEGLGRKVTVITLSGLTEAPTAALGRQALK